MAARKKTSRKKAARNAMLPALTESDWETAIAESVSSGEATKVRDAGLFLGGRGLSITAEGNDLEQPLRAVILDFVHDYRFFESDFDAENPQGPVCVAIGRDPDEMAPFDASPSKQADTCADCEWNEFGSGRGRAKRCRQGFRVPLAFVPEGASADDVFRLGYRFLMVPPTSLKIFNQYRRNVTGVTNRPLFGVVTEIEKVASEEHVFEFSFRYVENVGAEIGSAILQLRERLGENLTTPSFGTPEGETSDAAAVKRGAKARRTARLASGGRKKVTRKKR